MSETSPRLDLPYLQASQAQKHVTHNEALKRLDTLTQLVVEGFAAETPPVAPAPGEVHALGALPTGAWAGQAGSLAAWDGVAWAFVAPKAGWRAWGLAEADLRIFDGSDWIAVDGDHQDLDGIGIGTAWDAANRLAVASEASLFTHAGAGHRVKVNKAAAAETASLLFQTAFSGRAEMGLAGNDDFSVKVSPDGSAWTEALRIDRTTGRATGSAVQSSTTDATTGRLLTVGAFGVGSSDLPLASDANALFPGPSGPFKTYGAANTPLGSTDPGVLVHYQRSAGAATQVIYNEIDLETWTRHYAGGAWSNWSRNYETRNILGTVAQSGGVPTGAMIEAGSNANGRYVRFADGAQICAISDLTLKAAADATTGNKSATWTFPAAFSETANLAVSHTLITGSPSSRGAVGANSHATTSVSLSYHETAGIASDVRTRAIAIGRWF